MECGTMARALWITMVIFLLLGTPVHAESVVRVGGNGTGLELVKALVAGFEKTHPGIKIQVMKSLGSSGGIKALNDGALDIAMSSRPLKDDEKKQGATEVFLARTPFVFMANQSATKTDLSTKELEAIYAGSVTTWPDGSQVKLVLRPEGDTDTRTMQSISSGLRHSLDQALHRPGMLITLTDEDSDRYISRVRGALGVSSLAQVATGRLSCRIMSFNGITPSLETMASGAYPLAKGVVMAVNRSRVTAPAQAFVAFVRSPHGLRLLRDLAVIAEKQRGQ